MMSFEYSILCGHITILCNWIDYLNVENKFFLSVKKYVKMWFALTMSSTITYICISGVHLSSNNAKHQNTGAKTLQIQ